MPEEQQTPPEQPQTSYKDDDLVYVDPEQRVVVGLVEWAQNGRPISKKMKKAEEEPEEELPAEGKKPQGRGEKGARKKGGARPARSYPWGTYRSMKKVYKLEGKQPRVESQKTLDEVMEKALKEPFWD